jgi:hypothetical protein
MSGDDGVGELRELDHVKGNIYPNGFSIDEVEDRAEAVFERRIAKPFLCGRWLGGKGKKNNNQPEDECKSTLSDHGTHPFSNLAIGFLTVSIDLTDPAPES